MKIPSVIQVCEHFKSWVNQSSQKKHPNLNTKRISQLIPKYSKFLNTFNKNYEDLLNDVIFKNN